MTRECRKASRAAALAQAWTGRQVSAGVPVGRTSGAHGRADSAVNLVMTVTLLKLLSLGVSFVR